MTRRRLALSAALVVVVSIEAVSFAGLCALEMVKPGSTIELGMWRHFLFGVPEGTLRYARKRHDPELGWSPPPMSVGKPTENLAGETWSVSLGPWAERRDPVEHATLLAATYGDSFTKGDEADDDQTWQHFAGEELDSALWNFGMSGASTLQAVLRAERHLEEGWIAPVTILGIYESNVERVLMAFRSFRYPTGPMVLAFMPTLRMRGGAIRAYPPTWQDREASRGDLRRAAIASADHDYYAHYRLRVSFPFTLSAVRGLLSPPSRGPNIGEVWSSEEGQAVMDHLAERFDRSVRAAGSTPVFLFFPHSETLESGDRPTYHEFVARIRDRLPEVPVIDLVEREFDRERFNVSPFAGHPSEYGNRVIAELVVETLEGLDREPIPYPDPPGPEPDRS